MRFLKVGRPGEFSLTQNFHHPPHPYVILSHTWGEDNDEVTFKDLQKSQKEEKLGYIKLGFCIDQARKDGYEHVWVDTCCIDKDCQPELSEAINSMFNWYRNSAKCYVFMSDVSTRKRNNEGDPQWEQAFRNSKWFTRGWTLQELVAPRQVEFYSREGDLLGNKTSLEQQLHEITTIPISALRGAPMSDFSVTERMRWTQGRRTTRKEDEAYCLTGIFGVFMVPIYGEGKYAFVRLKDEIGKSYRHQLDEVCDSGNVENHAINTVSTSTLGERRKILLASLGFDQMDVRRSTIKTAYSTTCKWLLTHPAYTNWIEPANLQSHHGFLWISGKPGAGKSTLMKFAHAHAAKKKQPTDIIISFYFSARGDDLEKSTIGMYRALLFQLLEKAPDVQDILENLYQPNLVWTVNNLSELFCAAVARLGHRRLTCFIDALDECGEEQIREMIDVFESLGEEAVESGIELYMCLASRHYPTIDIRHGQRLTLEKEVGHGEDLAKYVRSHLGVGKRRYNEEDQEDIVKKANGVFLWAVLVIEILNKEIRSGRIFAIKKRLESIPPKLSDLFKEILWRDGTNMPDLLLCLQWILFAKRPLKREEFYFAMVAGLDPDPENLIEWNPEHTTLEDMDRFVLNSSKGLAELTKSKSPRVQFIHESVRDFLITDNGLVKLWPELGTDLDSLSHAQLRQCCQNYLKVDLSGLVPDVCTLPKASSESAADLRNLVIKRYPFLEYASYQILYHADQAAVGISQAEFLKNFRLDNWLKISGLLERYDVRRLKPETSLLYVLADKNCPWLIRLIHHQGSIMGSQGEERYHYPLIAALAKGDLDTVQAFLPQEETSLLQKAIAEMGPGISFSVGQSLNPVRWAIEKRYEATAEVLSSCLDLALEPTSKSGANVLSTAAAIGYTGVVKRMLQRGANIEARTAGDMVWNREGTALHYAAGGGYQATVRELLLSGANVEAIDDQSRTALHDAAESGDKATVRELLLSGAKIEAIDDRLKTVLHYAADKGDRATVRELLLSGANIEAIDDWGRTALHYAAKYGHEAIVQDLLKDGANIEGKDNSWQTALHWAVRSGREITVRQLIEAGADIEATDHDGRTPLSLAAEYQHLAIVRYLLDKNANVAAEDYLGITVLRWALNMRYDALYDYQEQLMLLERQKKRLMKARMEQDSDAATITEESLTDVKFEELPLPGTYIREAHSATVWTILKRQPLTEATLNKLSSMERRVLETAMNMRSSDCSGSIKLLDANHSRDDSQLCSS